MKSWWIAVVWAVSAPLVASAEVILSEINYAPPTDGQDTEFIEILNLGPGPADLSGWYWDGITLTVPDGTVLAPGGFLVAAFELIDTTDTNTLSFESFYGNDDGVADEFAYAILDYSGGLLDAGELIALRDAADQIIDSFDYSALVADNPDRRSLERHSAAPGDFVVGTVDGGTPGSSEVPLAAVPEPVSLALILPALLLVCGPLTRHPRRRR
jgi:hypothetical protein